MQTPNVIAVACGDLHLSLHPPVARSLEKDWLGVQAGYLQQLKKIGEKHCAPILCSGDIFDKWNAPAELINFSLEHLPDDMMCVPGNHDLPMHDLGDMNRSAYGTLAKAGKIIDLSHGLPHILRGSKGMVDVYGFAWGQELRPLLKKNKRQKGGLNIALIHHYVWVKGSSYPGAPDRHHANFPYFQKKLEGYDVAVFGDNHISFVTQIKNESKTVVVNNGGFQRRNIDEQNHKPRISLIYSNGTTETAFLNCDKDRFLKREEIQVIEEKTFGVKQFMASLSTLADTDVNFVESIDHYFAKYEVSKGARKMIEEAIHDET